MANLAAHLRSRQLTATFLTALQAEGFALGVGQHQAVQELLERLPKDTPEQVLGDSLAALLANSAVDQARCRTLFIQAQQQVDAMLGPAGKKNDSFTEEAQADRKKLLLRLAGLLGILLVPLLAWLLWPEQEIVFPERTITAVEGKRKFLGEVDSLPELGAISRYDLPEYGGEGHPLLGGMDTAGTRVYYVANRYDSLNFQDAFTITLHGTNKRFAELHFRVTIQKDTARTPVQREDDKVVEDEAPDLQPDFSPIDPLPHPRSLLDLVVPEPQGFGYQDFLRYAWWPLLLLSFGALLLGYYLYLRYRRRKDARLIAERDQFDGAPHFWRINIPDVQTAVDWGHNYPGLLRQFRRRREDDHLELDLDLSIRRTIEQGGLPSFSYRSATRPAEYLLLIDRGVHGNHYTRLFDQLYQQLRAEEVLIERYFYDGDPRLLYQEDRAKSVSLTSLQRRFTESRLLIVGPGDRLLSPATGKLDKWATDQFVGWKERSLLTTLPPGTWGVEERRLAEFFALLPATMQGLRLLVERTNDGQTSEASVDYRSLITDADERPIELSGSLIGSLLDHFSLPQTQWIAACALYPSLHWDLTLFMGQTVGEATNENLLTSRNLLSLARLPWFANGSIPKPVRAELTRWLRETAPELHETLRLALHDTLKQHAPAPEGSVARRNLDFFRLQNEWLLAAANPGRRAELSEELAREIAAGNDPDITVARILEEEKPPEGALPLPKSWNKRLYPDGLPALGYKPEVKRLWPALFLLLPFLLVGWWFQPDPSLGTDSCSSTVLTVLDTVSFDRDSLIEIQFCDKLDSLILAEYRWQHRINLSGGVGNLDSLAVRAVPFAIEGDKQTGLGSYYSEEYDGSKTAHGVTYNKNELVAAHRTYPFNSSVLVRNTENGQSAIVRIIDEGPFIRGRIIELSERAASDIDMLGKITVPVEITLLTIPDSPGENTNTSRQNSGFLEGTSKLSALLEWSSKDSLEQTYLANIAAMLWNKGVNYPRLSADGYSDIPCGYYRAADSLSPLSQERLLVMRIACASFPAQQPVPASDSVQPPTVNPVPAQEGTPTQESQPANQNPVDAVPLSAAINSCPTNDCGDFQVGANWTTLSDPKQFIVRMENRSNAGLDYFVVDWGDGSELVSIQNYSSLTHTYSPEIVAAGGEITVSLRGIKACAGGFSCEQVTSSVAVPDGAPEGAVPKPAMIKLPAGTFQMGDTFGEGEEDEVPVHTVTLSAFELGKYEVTFEEYDLYQQNAVGVERPDDYGWGRGRRPVIYVSWWDAVKYCNWLSEQHGYTPVYTINEAKKSITPEWTANGYRLPTEAEWEYAASVRADGTKARFGNGRDTLRATEANFNASAEYAKPYTVAGEYRGRTTVVGNFAGNRHGLRDMSGNVFEWCWDWYDDYGEDVKSNPYGVKTGIRRVFRGGGWYLSPSYCRAAYRDSFGPTYRGDSVGFRLARSY